MDRRSQNSIGLYDVLDGGPWWAKRMNKAVPEHYFVGLLGRLHEQLDLMV
jgi:hypothetical protein